jgi:predicted transcriptional regulator
MDHSNDPSKGYTFERFAPEDFPDLPPKQGQDGKLSLPKVVSSGQFVRGHKPPDYLVRGIYQRRYCYANTGATGAGKTNITLLLGAHVGLGLPLAGREIEQGRVLFLAGENPDDIKSRWIALADKLGFDVETIPVDFVEGVFDIAAKRDEMLADPKTPDYALCIVDTFAAFFQGDDENTNVEAGAHARLMRSLVNLLGGPCVLVNCHPVKNATAENLLPRGGGASLAEFDGNTTCAKNGTTTIFHWQGKIRGPEFEPFTFVNQTVRLPILTDSKGREVPTTVARILTEDEEQKKLAARLDSRDAMLIAILEYDGQPNPTSLSRVLGWNKMLGKRVCDDLSASKLIAKDKGFVELTIQGRKLALQMRSTRAQGGYKASC